MDQEKVAVKILFELIDNEIIKEEDKEIVWMYLLCAYAAGYNKGSKARSNKRAVVKLSLDGKPIEIFDSAADASRRTKVGIPEISKCARGKAHTAGGFKWKYVKKTDNESK